MSDQSGWTRGPGWGDAGGPPSGWGGWGNPNPPAWGAPPAGGPPPPGPSSHPSGGQARGSYGNEHLAPVYPLQVPSGMYPDPVSGLVLPKGTELASVSRRIGAYFLSFVLPIVTLGIGYLIWGAVVWGRGQTPTFQVLGMRCWRPETGRVAGWWWMALREVVGTMVDGILSFITLVISFVLMVSTRERQCLHDKVAGTVVLYDPNKVLRQ